MIDPILGYLDPGAGSIIIQSIVAGFLGFLVALKVFWSRIVAFLRGGRRKSSGAKGVPGKESSQ